MSWDDGAVGGFFEDLTVLLFVLVGVAVIVSAGVWTAQDSVEARADEQLSFLAHELLIGVLSEISHPETPGYLPTLDRIRSLDLLGIVDGFNSDCQFCISVAEHHPERAWLCSATRGWPEAAADTGSVSGFVNALDSTGMTALVEVMVLVW